MDPIAAALGLDLDDPATQASLEMRRQRHALIDELARVRNKRGLRQKDVAKVLGISREAVSRIERDDRDPHLSTLVRYADAVGAVISFDVCVAEESSAYKMTAARRVMKGSIAERYTGSWTQKGAEPAETGFPASDPPARQDRSGFVLAA